MDAYLEQDLQAHCNERNGCNEQSTDDDSSVPGLEIKGRRIWRFVVWRVAWFGVEGFRVKGCEELGCMGLWMSAAHGIGMGV